MIAAKINPTKTSPTDDGIWATAKGFNAFYKSEVSRLRSILKSYRLEGEDANDIIQESFLRLHAARVGIDASKARGFLIVTARNLALDLLRRKKFRRTDAVGEDIGGLEARLWNADQAKAERLAALSQAVEKIGAAPQADKVFCMFYGDGLSIKEIAVKTSEPRNIVTARLWRARQRYRDRIFAEVDAHAM